ncbi:MAG: hypothetical protein JW797_02295 [Bradymonadales bacterium]|nr:hypothetical protein [Bradymonadales bacterium]
MSSVQGPEEIPAGSSRRAEAPAGEVHPSPGEIEGGRGETIPTNTDAGHGTPTGRSVRLGGRTAVLFGILDVAAAAAYLVVLFALIPSRHPWFSALAISVCAILALGGLATTSGRRWGLVAGAAASALLLLSGLAVIWGLVASAAYLYGIYGGFGRGAAFVLIAVNLLVFQLVCWLPSRQLLWTSRLLRRGRAGE